jgi:predicted HicB family RNase H-like nuclease
VALALKVALNPEVIYLRVDPQLKAALTQCARENGRTLNSEVIQRLRRSIEGYRRL